MSPDFALVPMSTQREQDNLHDMMNIDFCKVGMANNRGYEVERLRTASKKQRCLLKEQFVH